MEIKIFSLFPEMFEGPLGSSLIGKAQEKDIYFKTCHSHLHHLIIYIPPPLMS